MSYIVQDRIEISVLFGNLNYPLNQFNSLNYLHLGSSVKVLVPTLKLSVVDQSGMLNNGLLVDGLEITIVLKTIGSNDTSLQYKFTLTGIESTTVENGTNYTIYGMGGGLQFFANTALTGIRGTSNDVIKEIANRCGLLYEGTNTSDSQLWMPQNRTWAVFARNVAKAGYVNDRSFMRLACTLDGRLRYLNLSNPGESVATLVQGHIQPNMIPVLFHEPKISNGPNNIMSGYGLHRYKQSIDSPELRDKVTYVPDSRTPMLNTQAKNQAGRGIITYSPLDFGNNNESYEAAIYQNRRLGSLYSVGCDFITTYATGLSVLDRINFASEQDSGEVDNSVTGQYILTAHAILVQGTNYYEKLEGFRQGTNWSSDGTR